MAELPTVREKLFQGEADYFSKNPKTAGMAADDNSVILNPGNGPDINRDSVVKNEQARILIRTGKSPKPSFGITDEQRSSFRGTPYEKDEQAMRETIAARILSGDSSSGKATAEQTYYVNQNLAPIFMPKDTTPLTPDREVEDAFVRSNALDRLGSDPNAVKSVQFDRTETRSTPDGGEQTVGIDNKAAGAVEISRKDPPKPEKSKISQVIENGVSYDVEHKADGTIWALGRTGEPRDGISVLLGRQPAPDEKTAPDGVLSPQERFRSASQGIDTSEEPRRPMGDPEDVARDILKAGEISVDLVKDLPDAIARGLVSGGAEALHLAGVLSDDEIKRYRQINEEARKAFDIPPGAELTEFGGSFMAPAGVLFGALKAAKLSPIVAGIISEGITAAVTQKPELVDIASLIPEKTEGLGGELRALLAINPDDKKFDKAAKVFAQNAGLSAVFLSVLPALKMAAKAARVSPEDMAKTVKDFVKDESGAFTAYHGSPHKFDRFADEAIGTGEGNQTFGYGHYFADRPGTATAYRNKESYKKTVSDFRKELPDDADFSEVVDLVGTGHFTSKQDEVIKALQADDWLGFDYPSQAISAAYRPDAAARFDMSPALQKAVQEDGHLYKTGLNVTDDTLLHWDKPLSEQPKAVREAVQSAFDEVGIPKAGEMKPDGESIHAWLASAMGKGEKVSDSVLKQRAAELLKAKGIKGIKYLDQGSRAGGEGTYNYVVFDPKDVTILERNGKPVAGAMAAGGVISYVHTDENDTTTGEEKNLQYAQLAPMIKRGVQALRGKAGREAIEHPPTPKAAEGQAEIADLYSAYRTDSPVLEGVDFNLENLTTADSVKEVIDTVSKVYAPAITARTGGVIPHDVTRQVADLIGADEAATARIITGLPSDTKDLHVRALVMRDMLVKSAEDVDRLANKVVNLPDRITDTDLLEFRRAIESHAALQKNMKGVQTDIARALSAFRIPADAGQLARAQMVREALQAGGGRDTVEELARLWVQTPVEKRAGLASEGIGAKSVGVLRELWINGLLSGLRTHEVNFVGNTLFTIWQVPERALAGAIGGVRQLAGAGPDRVYMGEAVDLMFGWVEGMPDALKLGWQTFKSGEPSSGLAKIESSQYRAISAAKFGLDEAGLLGRGIDLVGTGIRLPGRALMTADEFQKGIARTMERRALARRLSNMDLDRGKTVDEAASTYADVMLGGNRTAESMIDEFADMVTFTKQLGDAGQAIQAAARRVPGAWIIAPFIRTPTNIIKEAASRTPAVMLSKGFWKDVTAGGARGDLALAKLSLGTGIMAWGASLSAQGIIVGNGPSDPRMRRIWLEKYSPYSINLKKMLGEEQFAKMGLVNEWLPYGRIDPLAIPLGIAADFSEYRQWAPRDIAEEGEELLAARAVASTVEAVAGKTYLRGLGEFAAAYHDPERYGQRFVTSFVSSIYPFSSMVRDIESAVDPARSDTRANPYEKNPFAAAFLSTLNEYRARTPGMNADLPQRTNFWGEPVVAYEGEWYQAFNAFAPRKDKSRPIDNELIRLRYPLAMPSRQAAGVKLNPHQYFKLVTAMNSIAVPHPVDPSKTMKMRQYFDWLIKSPGYLVQINDEKKIDTLKDVRNNFVDAARDLMVTPGSEYFDADLFALQIRAKTQKPLGMPLSQ